METIRPYWQENGHGVKYENYHATEEFRTGEQLGFAAPSEDEEYQAGFLKKGKVSRQDPMSHRIIEKRRRDRMNNCLADLSRLIPPEYLKKGRGRVEKTEIIEMAIRHIKFLQDRANADSFLAAERETSQQFRAGFQEAVTEAVRFLELQGYVSADGLCSQLAVHLQRNMDLHAKGETAREKSRVRPSSSSGTASSSSSSHGYSEQGVITRCPEPPLAPEPFEAAPEHYAMECDRVPSGQAAAPEPRRAREPTLRAVRKPDHGEDFLHSYKFKNSIERRFSMAQDCEAAMDEATRGAGPGYGYKRRRAAKPASSTSSTERSGSAEEARGISPQDTSSGSPHQHYEKPLAPPAQYVPVFALNSLGKYYVPMSVEAACLARQPAACDASPAAPLHPVTIHVNFQPCLGCHVKREPEPRAWAPL